MLSGALAFCAAIAAPCALPAQPWIAEVFYDAIGDDSGHEFVELWNPTDLPAPLAGVRLEAGDGSAPGRWTLRWTGGERDTIPPRARFVIGGARVVPAPRAVVTLDLQNGPDAVRLVFGDGATAVVGWGALEHPEYFCGKPAVDVASGQSLARIPDGANAGSNAVDFRSAAPSPGHPNQAAIDAAIVPGTLALDPPQPDPETFATLRLAVANHGIEAIPRRALRVEALSRGASGERRILDALADTEVGPGDTVALEIHAGPFEEGRQRIACRIHAEGDERGANDADTAWVRAGPGPLEITEIQFHPAHDEGEWVEVRNRSRGPLALEEFTLSDRGATRGRIASGGVPCAPESLAVLAQNRAALLAAFPELDSTRVRQVSPWASLNNSNDASGTADAVVLREIDGVPCARHDYSAAGVPAGVPIERGVSGWWGPATEAAGSPLRPPRPLAIVSGRFQVTPRRFAGTSGARLAWSLPWDRARVAAELYALSGARVGSVLTESVAPGRAERDWRPDGIGPGVYLLVFLARPADGGEGLSASQVVRIDGGRR